MRRIGAAILAFCGWLLLSAAWSLPWAAGDAARLPTRQFDLYGVVWVLSNARDILDDLRSSVSGLPEGEDLARLDTWVLAAIGAALQGHVSPVGVARLVVLVGPALGAFAAERCAARGLGVRPPWSAIAGVAWGFASLGATALLEGHVYYLLDPWLPLLAWALFAATGPGGGARHGLAAGVMWALALATSAYTGLLATGLAVALFARGWAVRLDRRGTSRAAAAFLAPAAPVGVAYTLLFLRGSGAEASDPATVLAGGSATLATLATWSPGVDLTNHSIAAPLGFSVLALVLAAPRALRDVSGWRTLAALALGAVAVSLGPAVQVGMGGRGTFHWVDLRGAGMLFSFLHFPVRALALWSLCGGLVAARVAEALAARVGRRALPILGIVLVDAFVTSGFPLRVSAVDATTPSAYAAAPTDRPLLDLLPEDPHAGSGLDLWMRRLACAYQAAHRRPVIGRCLGPHGAPPHEAEERALRAALLDGDDPLPPIRALNLGSVAVHVDLFRPGDRKRVLDGLARALGPPAVSHDAGETVAVFVVP